MQKRINDFKKQLNKQKLDALIISDVAHIAYLTGFSNFYGPEREAFLFLTKGKQFILTDGRYSEPVRNLVKNFELLEISSTKSLKKIFEDLAKELKIKKVGIEDSNLTHKEYKRLSGYFKLINVDLTNKRSVKSSAEIDLIEKACELGDRTFTHISKRIKKGITEKKLAFEIEFFIKKSGGDISFPPLVAFDNNSSIPHHRSGDRALDKKDGQFVMFDFGTKVDGYCSDMTRTIFFGKTSPKQKDIYKIVKEAQQKAIDYISKQLSVNKKIKAADVDKIAREYILEKGYPTIPHSLGHGIGLEVHERPSLSPKSKDYLENGMVFSIEPGIYIPDFGGVRIEDLFVIESKRLRQLTKSSKELIEI
ncbi:MAG: Xaa-Pro peptidase family protein [Candidatus Daviesbacteria bacterium]|nr:Xaa-Pro peptidase family protein [Candidatus Daviesbacteria bacterium]